MAAEMIGNRCIVLRSRPGVENEPTESNFALKTIEISSVSEGQVLARTLFLSVDPYMRCQMNEHTGTGYLAPWSLGQPPKGGGLGTVVKSKCEGLREGDILYSFQWPWKEFVVFSGDDSHLSKESSPFLCSNPSLLLGIVGMTGLTSYFGIREKAHIKSGTNQSVVISGAAGACGMAAGQIAKLDGCGMVIGICGSDDKCHWLTDELGFDYAINYKTTKNIKEEIQLKCPAGIDVYFDNVGGEVSNEVIRCMNPNSHVVLCGQIAMYNKDVPYPPPIPEDIQNQLRNNNITRDRFLVLNYVEKFQDAKKQLEAWVREGKLKYRETIEKGLENTGRALVSLMRGGNIGKQVVKVAQDD
ncbi:prostaglandin reductase 2-like [Montipora capricornis]|uniref:prostaglandin reductase 2-like n=1 Tax=Montipora capricornis TaxID=246305 RepID=UPI0035F1ED33